MMQPSDFPIGPNEAKRLRLLSESGFADGSRVPALDELCADAKADFGTKFAIISLLTQELQLIKARAGIDVDSTPRGLAFCNYTILSDSVFVVLDATKDIRFRDNPLTNGEPFIRFYAGAPLIYINNIRLGAFCLLDTTPRAAFSTGDKAELADYAERASHLLIQHLRLTA
ncbi:MAG: GAF domain-containing protein [Loktanella sp.]|nr:GAF domain-containing protein [Loktanella sp.]